MVTSRGTALSGRAGALKYATYYGLKFLHLIVETGSDHLHRRWIADRVRARTRPGAGRRAGRDRRTRTKSREGACRKDRRRDHDLLVEDLGDGARQAAPPTTASVDVTASMKSCSLLSKLAYRRTRGVAGGLGDLLERTAPPKPFLAK